MVLIASDALAVADEFSSSSGLFDALGVYLSIAVATALIFAIAMTLRGDTISVYDAATSVLRIPVNLYQRFRERVLKLKRRQDLMEAWEMAQVDLIDGWYEKELINRAERRFLYALAGRRTRAPGIMPRVKLSSIIKRRLNNKTSYKPVVFSEHDTAPPATDNGKVLNYRPVVNPAWHGEVKRAANKAEVPVHNEPMNELDRIVYGRAAA